LIIYNGDKMIDTVTGLLAAGQQPVGTIGSLYKDPSAEGRNALLDEKTSLLDIHDYLGLPQPNVSAFDNFDTTVSNHFLGSNGSPGKIDKMPQELALTQSASAVRNIISQAEPTQPGPTTNSSGCPSLFDDIFGTIKKISSIIGDALTSIKSAFQSVFDHISTFTGKIYNSIKDLAKDVVGNPAVKSFLQGWSDLTTRIGSAISDTITTVGKAIGDFTTLVQKETAELGKAMKDLLNFHFLRSLNTTNPCVQDIHNQTINKDQISPNAIDALNSFAIT
jgi:hypothetical protein